MPQNYFIVGLPKAGKTTILWRLVKELKKEGLKVGGFVSPEEKHHGTRNAFHVVDIETGKEGMLADVKGDGPKVSKYHVNLKSFESIVLPSMKDCKKYDVFFIDEIGSMEMSSEKFAQALESVIESHVPLIASLNSKYQEKYGVLGEIFEVKTGNREDIHKTLLAKAKSIGKDKTERKKKISKNKVRKSIKKQTSKPKTQKEKKDTDEIKVEKMQEEKVQSVTIEEETKEDKQEKKGFFGKIKDFFGL